MTGEIPLPPFVKLTVSHKLGAGHKGNSVL